MNCKSININPCIYCEIINTSSRLNIKMSGTCWIQWWKKELDIPIQKQKECLLSSIKIEGFNEYNLYYLKHTIINYYPYLLPILNNYILLI